MSAIVYQSPVAPRGYSVNPKSWESSIGVVTAVHGPTDDGPTSTLYSVAPAILNRPFRWTSPPKGWSPTPAPGLSAGVKLAGLLGPAAYPSASMCPIGMSPTLISSGAAGTSAGKPAGTGQAEPVAELVGEALDLGFGHEGWYASSSSRATIVEQMGQGLGVLGEAGREVAERSPLLDVDGLELELAGQLGAHQDAVLAAEPAADPVARSIRPARPRASWKRSASSARKASAASANSSGCSANAPMVSAEAWSSSRLL